MNRLAEAFWNFRGDMRIAGIVNVGTHMSLLRRADGRFLLLDSYTLEGRDLDELMSLTDGGRAVEAILNLHPFHTLHCRPVHQLLPRARLIGTRRHVELLPDLPWETGLIEEPSTQAEFAAELAFSVPDGVDFISEDESVHVGSVLARHRQSGILHVDDTLNVLVAPKWLQGVLPAPRLRFHPKLARALKPEPLAAEAYAAWARRLAEDWSDTPVVCTAHNGVHHLEPGGFQRELLKALGDASSTLDRHRARYG